MMATRNHRACQIGSNHSSDASLRARSSSSVTGTVFQSSVDIREGMEEHLDTRVSI